MEVWTNHRKGRCRRAISGLLAALACVLPAQAQLGPPVSIDDGGSYNITSPLDNGSTDAYIGIVNNNNSLTISGAGWLFGVSFGYIGMGAGSDNNTVTVSGGGQWDLGLLFLGDTGAFNNLTIASGGRVTSTSGSWVGNNTGANNNSILVTGASSLLDNNNNSLFIGNAGSANSMVIDSGARVLAGDGGFGGGAGAIGVDSNSINNSVLVSGNGSLWHNSGDLYIGVSGSSNRLTIANGGVVVNTNGLIGVDGGSGGGLSNFVIVTGAGSLWSNSTSVVVGDMNGASSNNLFITSGGWVISDNGLVGSSAASSNNAVFVTGSGSLWTNSSDLYVGSFGSYNSLVIANTARVMNAGGYIGWGLGALNNLVAVTGGAVWTNSGGLFVGNYGSFNILVITNSSQVFNNDGHIGEDTNAIFNSVLVSGTNSLWNNNGQFNVGAFGSGNQLMVNNGGRVAVLTDSFIGRMNVAGSNSVLVTGSGSVWTNGGDLYVGYDGYGNSLSVASGGRVENRMGFIGYSLSASNNSVMVNGGGSVWRNTNGLAVGYLGSYNSLVVTNGGVVINTTTGGVGILFGSDYNRALISGNGSTWSNGSGFAVGYFGSGNQLAVNDGGRLVSGDASIGEDSAATNNAVLVTGNGTVWAITADEGRLGVGEAGSGNSLTIADGGMVTNFSSEIGRQAVGSNNWVLVTGAGSVWSSSNHITVGDAGSRNQLIITNGGLVLSTNSYIGKQTSASNNSALVSGSGSLWTNSSDLYVGYAGPGNSLTINAGGRVWNSGKGDIGYDGTSNTVLVSGSGSQWINDWLVVGDHTAGNSLTITNGGQVFNTLGYIGFAAAASNNAVTVAGAGSVWSNSSDLYVGVYGAGNQLVVTNGGAVIAGGKGDVGYDGANNTVLVSGDGSRWINGGWLVMGDHTAGNGLTIANSGQVFNTFGFIGYAATASNNWVAVVGSGSVWSNTSQVTVGYAGVGNQLVVTNGGAVIAGGNAFVGYIGSSTNNAVLVTGSGSLWTNSGDLYLGYTGSFNRLMIANTGMVANSMTYIGFQTAASNNNAMVSGNGSVWETSNGFGVGYGGAFNSLVITNGGAVLNVTTGGVGILPGANFNTALISGSGSVWSNGQGFAVGLFGIGNRLTINDGGRLVSADAVIGENAGANSNVIVVTDSGSVWSNRDDLNIGIATVGNQLVITNGGVVRTLGNISIGTNASLLNNATLYVGGDFQNFATNQAINNFSGTNIFNGSGAGGAWFLQNLEVASAFATAGLGTATNSIGDATSGSNAWVRLVDNRANQTSVGVETFGASNVVVALAQSILDLNNRTSFIQNLSNSGTILQTNAGPPGLVTRLDVVNTFTNAGTVLVGNGSVLQFSNAFVNDSVVQLLAGGVITNFISGSVLTNNASRNIVGDGLIAALIRNDGSITASGGTLRLSAGFSGDAAGNPVNAGVLRAIGAGAALEVSQSFTNTGTIAITNASFTSLGLVNQNLVRVDNQSTATFNGAATNAFGAMIRVSNQSRIQFNGSLTNQGTLALVNPSTAIITGTLLLGPTGVLTMSATSSVMMLRGNFVNGSTNNADFDTRSGTIFFGGSTPFGSGAATNLFEVAGTNRGPSALGFNQNFAVGTLNITNHVQFVNLIHNGGGLGTNEALYVDVLHLFNGATIKLSQLTVYVGMSFVDDAAGQTFNGEPITAANVANYHGYDLSGHIFLDSGGQIVFIPEPSAGLLLLTGVAAFAQRRRSRRKATPS
jgi:T5SS/PEP-CTERM-associated repeat protein